MRGCFILKVLPPMQTPTQNFKNGFSIFISQEIGSSLVSLKMFFFKLHNLKLFRVKLNSLSAIPIDDLPHILAAELTRNITINDSISTGNSSDTAMGSEPSINHHNYIKMNIFSSENILGLNKMSVLFLFVVYHQ